MGLFKTLAIGCLCIPIFAFGEISEALEARLLYLMHHQKPKEAFTLYLESIQGLQHDYALLQKMAKVLLHEGAKNPDPEIQLMCLVAFSISSEPSLHFLLRQSLDPKKEPQLQLATVSILGKMQDDRANELLKKALASPYLLLRLEAIYHLAKNQVAEVFEPMQSLFAKCPPEALPLFAQIAVELDDAQNDRFIRQLLSHQNVHLRVEMLKEIRKHKLDHFTDQIVKLASESQVSQQEAAFLTLAVLQNSCDLDFLERGRLHAQPEVSLAALVALASKSDKSALLEIQERAKKEELFAFDALATLEDLSSAKIFRNFLENSSSSDIKLNALCSLLRLKETCTVEQIAPFLLDDGRDLGYLVNTSPGGGFQFFRALSSAHQNDKNYPLLLEKTIALKQQLLIAFFENAEDQFLSLAKLILAHNQKELLPLTLQLLENIHNDEIYDYLYQQTIFSSSSFVRGYAALTLFRLEPNQVNTERLLRWIKAQINFSLIQVKQKKHELHSALSYEETSQLFLESLEALVMQKSSAAIETLLYLIAHGNEKNRYALAGLLIKTAE